MKRARMLLRVSSSQQLEADGDLAIQRQLVKEYAKKQADWKLDSKEYFEGSNSGYKNSVAKRNVLQEALRDAGNGEYDILVAYKDDRIGRRMWEIGSYVMELKRRGVDIYTVKDGCISPENNDIMGQMVLALRYGNAQKSSADTGARVKDTAQKLAQKGKFMGGNAPYGYQLALSGEISKHGRALHKLVIIPERADAVRRIYELSLYKEYGSQKIARILNEHETYKHLAPNTVWKSGTITSILTNPIYAGHTAYKRRESVNGRYCRQDDGDWIVSLEANEEIRIIDDETWKKTQEKRKLRRDKFGKKAGNKKVNVISRNDGMLALADVIYCGYCGRKLSNGSKYNYWTMKGTGEKRTSKTPAYRCKNAWQDAGNHMAKEYRADQIESVVFDIIADCMDELLDKDGIRGEIEESQDRERKRKENGLQKEKRELLEARKKIDVMESHIPDAMTGEYPFSLEELSAMIHKRKRSAESLSKMIQKKEEELKNNFPLDRHWEDMREKIPTWRDIFLHAETSGKRALAKSLIERVDVKKDEIKVRFKLNLNCAQSRISGGFGVPEQGL